MSSIELGDAYERHEYLPTAVNWLGPWNVNTVYFKHDVVSSPINTASYIMIGPPTTILGGDDPSINTTNWFQYGASILTVQNINVGDGIELTGTDTYPILKNTGVISVVPGDGFTNIGTAIDPILACETLTAIVPGLGINVFGLPTPNIVNTGVVYLREGAGVSITRTGQTNQVTNTGVLSLAAAASSPGLTVSSGPIKTIANTGLLTVSDGVGIGNTGTTTEPILTNEGVINLTPLNGSIRISGTKANLLISSNIPQKTVVWIPNATTAMTPNPVFETFTRGRGIIPVTSPDGLWKSCVATGSPYSTGFFSLSIPFLFRIDTQSFLNNARLTYALYDAVNNVAYEQQVLVKTTAPFSFNRFVSYSIGNIVIDLEALRKTGFRQLSSIQIAAGNAAISFRSAGGTAYATYYQTLDGLS